jgi:hypothetical protein
VIRWKTILFAVGAVVLTVPSVQAQQTQQIQARLTPQQQQRANGGFPMTADAYEKIVQRVLKRVRAMRPIGPVTSGDINKGVLLFRDCTSRVESDGVVTFAEMHYCNEVIRTFQREKLHEIMMSSTPDEWKQWMQQSAAANGHH